MVALVAGCVCRRAVCVHRCMHLHVRACFPADASKGVEEAVKAAKALKVLTPRRKRVVCARRTRRNARGIAMRSLWRWEVEGVLALAPVVGCCVSRAWCVGPQAEKARHQATARKCAGLTAELAAVQQEMDVLRNEAQKAAKMCVDGPGGGQSRARAPDEHKAHALYMPLHPRHTTPQPSHTTAPPPPPPPHANTSLCPLHALSPAPQHPCFPAISKPVCSLALRVLGGGYGAVLAGFPTLPWP
jgi:hypothetical protein